MRTQRRAQVHYDTTGRGELRDGGRNRRRRPLFLRAGRVSRAILGGELREQAGGEAQRSRFRRSVLSGLASVALASLFLGAPALARAQGPVVNAYPIPGSKVAAPQTQIAFRGVPAAGLGTITVTGSQSGVHSGQLEPDSDNRGASFIPAQPFVAGETVTVSTSLNIQGGQGGSFQFQVPQPAGR